MDNSIYFSYYSLMRVLKKFCIAILVAANCNFANAVNQDSNSSSSEIASQTKFEFDKFERMSKWVGPHYIDGVYGNAFYHDIFLRAFKDRKGVISYEIYVTTYYSDARWMHYKNVFDSQGARLSLTSYGYDVDTSEAHSRLYKVEDFAINVSRKYLERQLRQRSIEFKITGSGGTMRLELPTSYIEGFLLGMKEAGEKS